MNDTRHRNGLTLIELLVAMIVTSIVMTAVATLAFAVSSATKATDDTSEKQAQIRFATLKISDLIRHSKLICHVTSEELLVWRADDTPGGDNKINAGELVYIEISGNNIQLLDFPDVPIWLQTVSFDLAQLSGLKAWFVSNCTARYTVLVTECSNVQFGFLPELPPRSNFVTVSFDVVESGIEHQYQIDAALLGWAENLISDSNDIVDGDDD
jgi:prepilin-type N-terminal cleavage/methylation domain-containing protein